VVNKSERLLNLLILLLVQRHYISKDRIRATVDVYRDATDEAFERMFERDKDELRALGVPIELGNVDPLFDDETGYRIRPDEFALPGIELSADEAAVVGLATRVWQHAGLAGHTSDALAKLTAAGVEIDRSRLDIAAPVVTVDDPNFDVFWQASLDKVVVTFDYQRSGAAGPTTRTLEPWGVVSFSGRWYAVGRDVDREEERLFRLSRVQGKARRVGRAGAYDVPPGTNLRELTKRLGPGPRSEKGTVLARTGTCLGLRRYATLLDEGVPGPDGTNGWDRLEVAYPSADQFADDVLALGPSACAESPEEVRKIVVARLTAAVGESA
jgi:proteasome accessory factor B